MIFSDNCNKQSNHVAGKYNPQYKQIGDWNHDNKPMIGQNEKNNKTLACSKYGVAKISYLLWLLMGVLWYSFNFLPNNFIIILCHSVDMLIESSCLYVGSQVTIRLNPKAFSWSPFLLAIMIDIMFDVILYGMIINWCFW